MAKLEHVPVSRGLHDERAITSTHRLRLLDRADSLSLAVARSHLQHCYRPKAGRK